MSRAFVGGVTRPPIIVRATAELAAAALGEIVEHVRPRSDDGIRRDLRLLKIGRRLNAEIWKAQSLQQGREGLTIADDDRAAVGSLYLVDRPEQRLRIAGRRFRVENAIEIIFDGSRIEWRAIAECHPLPQVKRVDGVVAVDIPAFGEPGRELVVLSLSDERVDDIAGNQCSDGIARDRRVDDGGIGPQSDIEDAAIDGLCRIGCGIGCRAHHRQKRKCERNPDPASPVATDA